jgi:hypothetical protein
VLKSFIYPHHAGVYLISDLEAHKERSRKRDVKTQSNKIKIQGNAVPPGPSLGVLSKTLPLSSVALSQCIKIEKKKKPSKKFRRLEHHAVSLITA